MYDVACQVLEHKQQSIESGNHRNADVLHRSRIVGRGIVNGHRGEQIVVLVGHEHLQIGATHEGPTMSTLGSLGDFE